MVGGIFFYNENFSFYHLHRYIMLILIENWADYFNDREREPVSQSGGGSMPMNDDANGEYFLLSLC